MYETYTHQALPSREYRLLLGTALCVFNSNNAFIIENILRIESSNYDWYKLMDLVSGKLDKAIEDTITKESSSQISSLFNDFVKRRNRIVHSFQITSGTEQILSTKDLNQMQYPITDKYLLALYRITTFCQANCMNYEVLK
jgi:hypothetical protein